MALSLEDLNGFEMIELKKLVGGRLESADGIDTVYALVTVFKKRDNADHTHNESLGMSFKDAQAFLGLDEDDEPSADPFADDANDPKD